MPHSRTYLLKLALIIGISHCPIAFTSDDDGPYHWAGRSESSEYQGPEGSSNSNWPPLMSQADFDDFVVSDDVIEYEPPKHKKKASKKRAKADFAVIELSDEVTPIKKTTKKTPQVFATIDNSDEEKKASKKKVTRKKRAIEDEQVEVNPTPATKKPATKKPAKRATKPTNDNSHTPDKILKVKLDRKFFKTDAAYKATLRKFKNRKIAFVDFETTSFSPKIGGRAVSFGILLMDNGVEVLRREDVFNPGKDSNAGAFKAHHISRSVTRQMPYFHEKADEIFEILSQADTLVAHNAKFDHRYLMAEFQQSIIRKKLQRWNLEKLLDPNCPIGPEEKAFVQEQLKWINEDPHIQDKRLDMFKHRLTTALWLYMGAAQVLVDNCLYNARTGRFQVPFLPEKKETGYTKNFNAALFKLVKKMEALEGRTKTDRDRLNWKKFDSIDLSKYPGFGKNAQALKEVFDNQIKAVNTIKKFTFLELTWDKVYDWRRVVNKESVFYNSTDKAILNQITGFLNLAKFLVDKGLYKNTEELPAFLDYESRWEDTYEMAKQKLRKGQDVDSLKLDALCDFYNVDRSTRKDGHGALIDSALLAKVYAHLNGTDMDEVAPANDNTPAAKPTKKASVTFLEDDEDADRVNEQITSEEPEEAAVKGKAPADEDDDDAFAIL